MAGTTIASASFLFPAPFISAVATGPVKANEGLPALAFEGRDGVLWPDVPTGPVTSPVTSPVTGPIASAVTSPITSPVEALRETARGPAFGVTRSPQSALFQPGGAGAAIEAPTKPVSAPDPSPIAAGDRATAPVGAPSEFAPTPTTLEVAPSSTDAFAAAFAAPTFSDFAPQTGQAAFGDTFEQEPLRPLPAAEPVSAAGAIVTRAVVAALPAAFTSANSQELGGVSVGSEAMIGAISVERPEAVISGLEDASAIGFAPAKALAAAQAGEGEPVATEPGAVSEMATQQSQLAPQLGATPAVGEGLTPGAAGNALEAFNGAPADRAANLAAATNVPASMVDAVSATRRDGAGASQPAQQTQNVAGQAPKQPSPGAPDEAARRVQEIAGGEPANLAIPRTAPGAQAQSMSASTSPGRFDYQSALSTRINGTVVGTLTFVQTERELSVHLGALVELVKDQIDPAEYQRIKASPARDSYVPLSRIKQAGIPIDYDPVYDEFTIGSKDHLPTHARKVHIDQVNDLGPRVDPITMDQIIRR
ncbi:hypothetical protein [Erythrobacter sp.]|uniref:hypothetical protein n=1 Tax=Erythrobacter sp. TaxID=1042 RepID=UPI00262163B1|nr:hypothetical protein [Erythrobacter sp.]